MKNGLIDRVTPLDDPIDDAVTLVPGFIDIQVNGAGDVDVSTASARELGELCDSLARTGVTGWLPTVVTRPLISYSQVLDRIGEVIDAQRRGQVHGAEILGVHLEGPFLGDRPGAHRRELFVSPTTDFIEQLPDWVRLVTLGPEVPGAAEATKELVERRICVAIGHTAASAEQLDAVHSAGAELVTHVFNAMTGVHHRDHGVASWALTTDTISTSIIADGHHVGQAGLEIALRCKPTDRLIAVTDSVAHNGHGLHADAEGEPARTAEGTLAGSTVAMDVCLRNLVAAGHDLDAAVAATSANPARLLGLDDRGEITVGKRGDMVALDDQLRVRGVWRSGVRLL